VHFRRMRSHKAWLGAAHWWALPIRGGAHLLAPEVPVLHAQSFDRAAAGLPIRRLSAADLAAIAELAADRGWPPEQNKWRLLFAVSEAYGIDDPAGGLAAMAALTRYGPQLAAVGTTAVASRFGRRGLGRRLMTYLLGQAGPAVVYLAANTSSYARPLFHSLGFHSIDTVTRHVGRFAPRPRPALPGSLRPASMSDREPMAALDRKIFGADRRHLLTELFGFAEQVLVAQDARGALAGFAAAWRNDSDLVIGPLVAADPALAQTLITAIAAEENGSVRVDIRGGHLELAPWAAARGLIPCGSATLMVHGGNLPGERDKLFAPVSGATG
jgi:ribosomal protein S18 acetylase RimI-like enzyme